MQQAILRESSAQLIKANSYGQILKSSAFIGGSQVINVVLGIVRTKFLAMMLGPEGVGLIGLYQGITSTAGTLAGMGINSSGVRQIAEASGTGDSLRIARTVKALRRTVLILGILGTLLLLALCQPIASFTFGNTGESGMVALLSLVVVLTAVNGGQTALIQGLRRIKDLAVLNVLGALLGTVFSLPLVYWFGSRGIVPFLVVVAFMTILPSWWFARQVAVHDIPLSWRETWAISKGLLGLGLAFMLSGLLGSASAYFNRVIIRHDLGVDAAGIYVAAWTLAGYYVRFILQALAADYYPRLTAVADDHKICTRMINEQVEVAMALALPGVLATLAFAPLVIQLFYSSKFDEAALILRWQTLGILLQVIWLPLGFVVLAKGRSLLFFVLEAFSNLLCVGLMWVGAKYGGLQGTGMAFLAHYLVMFIVVCLTVKKLVDFRWSRPNLRLLLIGFPSVILVFAASFVLSSTWFTVLGAAATVIIGAWCVSLIYNLLGKAGIEALRAKVKRRLGFADRS